MRILFLLKERTEDAKNIFFIIWGVYAMKGKKKNHGKLNAYQRKQKRYIEQKKNSQKVALINKEYKGVKLEALKEMFMPLVEESNKRIESILEAGYYSMALQRVEQVTKKEYFDLENIHTREDLIARVTAMRVFLADKGSTVNGAKLETIQASAEKYRGKFGNQYNNKENNFARYDTSIIDKEVAERAFSNYRRIEEKWAYLIGKQGDAGVYGSENLIIAMYDAEIRGLDSLNFGMDLIETFQREQDTAWKPIEDEAESTMAISGYYEDNLRKELNF